MLPTIELEDATEAVVDLADESEQSFWNRSGIGGHGPTDMVRFFQGRRTLGVDDPDLPI